MLDEITSLLGMLLAVIVILALAWWVTSLIARQGLAGWAGVSGFAKNKPDELCVLRQIPVSRSERLVLVRLHNRCLLLGAAQGGVSLLAELTEEEAQPWLEQTAEAGASDFRRLMRMSTKK